MTISIKLSTLQRAVLAMGLMLVASLSYLPSAHATVSVNEDFTGTTTTNPWYYYGGACLTASDTSGNGRYNHGPGTPPGCVSDTYYNEPLVGGYTGTLPDKNGLGALRLTNGCISGGCGSGGYYQSGAIISADTFSTNQGLDITFKTVTYRGNSDGGDGADGISFFLIDAAKWSADADSIGSYGGSLGYSCSNVNNNNNNRYHGMAGAYLGLGIDEYGNFLNGWKNSLNEQGSSPWMESPYHDNTATGGFYEPNRIGLRGDGSIAWQALTQDYPDDYPDTVPGWLQPQAVQNTCETGHIWNYSHGNWGYETDQTIPDYQAIPNAYEVIHKQIAREYNQGATRALTPPRSPTTSRSPPMAF